MLSVIALTTTLFLPTFAAQNDEQTLNIDPPDSTLIQLACGDSIGVIASLDIHGDVFSSRNIFGQEKFLLISFFTTYCQPCITEFAEFKQLIRQSNDSLVVLLVNTSQESRGSLVVFQEEHNIHEFVIIRDKFERIRQQFGVGDNVPITFLVDPTGHILYAQYGAFPEGRVNEILWQRMTRHKVIQDGSG